MSIDEKQIEEIVKELTFCEESVAFALGYSVGLVFPLEELQQKYPKTVGKQLTDSLSQV